MIDKLRLLLLVCVLAIFSGSAIAADSCVQVYRDAVRDFAFSIDAEDSYNALFSNYCKSDGSLTEHALKTNFKMTDFIDGSSDGRYASKSLSEFCDIRAKETQSRSIDVSRTSLVQAAALRSFNDCEAILSKGNVLMTHTSIPDGIAITVELPTNLSFAIDSIIATAGTTCTIPNLDAASSNGKVIQVDAATGRVVLDKTFNITCTRVAETDKQGRHVARSEIVVASSVGQYHAVMIEDTMYAPQLASEASARIAKLEADLQAASSSASTLEAELKKERDRFGALWIKADAAFSGGADPGKRGHPFDESVSKETIQAEICKDAIKSDIASIGAEDTFKYYTLACLFDGPKP